MLDFEATAQARKEQWKQNAELAQKYLEEFHASYPTNEACLDFVLEAIGISKNWCRHCEATREGHIGRRSFKCNICHKKTWFTAPLKELRFFRHMRQPRYWAAALYLKSLDIATSSNLFANLVGCSSSTACIIFKKLVMVVVTAMKNENGGVIHVRNFAQVITRRSISTRADSHPRTEIIDLADEEKAEDDRIETALARLDEDSQLIYKHIKTSPTLDEELMDATGLPVQRVSAGLLMLRFDNLIISPAANRFQRIPRSSLCLQPDADIASAVGTIEFIKNVWSGSSCKMIQLAAAECWRLSDRQRWGGNALLEACAKHPPISDRDVRNYPRTYHIMIHCRSEARLDTDVA